MHISKTTEPYRLTPESVALTNWEFDNYHQHYFKPEIHRIIFTENILINYRSAIFL